MATVPRDSIWSSMNYVPPRGRCNHKPSLLSNNCSCLRFMVHPLKISSSFDCDGCNHHACFHSMENRADDEVVKRWQREAVDNASNSRAIENDNSAANRPADAPPPRKRLRARDNADNDGSSTAGAANAGHGTSRQTGRSMHNSRRRAIAAPPADADAVAIPVAVAGGRVAWSTAARAGSRSRDGDEAVAGLKSEPVG
ncbi:hypothetical protein LTR16_003338 [Cryomyces antarcticus]|uniref:Uncharacterized protein n=1 Tax=Cryomyces antarcticus TaxID=329879 RepID=A0ABR0M7A2_9PEZI|nr:hypothetical protein LTR16_003338 [Cryomyces antarcticus]